MPAARIPDFTNLPEPSSRFGDTCRQLKTGGGTIAVALSGGVDSTAALVWALTTFGKERLVALHYHHGVRGEYADRDLAAAAASARAAEIPFKTGTRLPGGPSDEAALRRDRLAFFMRAMRESGAVALIQGHHADDVAETLLMRLARGSGTAGLAAPRPVSALPDGIPILRPFLLVGKAVLRRRLDEAGIPWVHDETNDDPAAATRNRVRATLMPLWSALPGDPVAGAARTRALAEEDDEALAAWATREMLTAHVAPGELDRRAFDGLPIAVKRRMLRQFLNRVAPAFEPTSAAFDALTIAAGTGVPHALSLGRYGTLRCDKDRCVIDTPAGRPVVPDALLPVPGSVFFPDGGKLDARPGEPGSDDDHRTVSIRSVATLTCGVCRDGERYRPAGSGGSKKLREAMGDRKIPVSSRERLPVIRDDDAAVWCPGLPPSHAHRAAADEIKALRLTWTPPDAA